MALTSTVARAARIIRRQPSYAVERAVRELRCELDRWTAPRRQAGFGRQRLLRLARASTIDELWQRLRARSYPALTSPISPELVDRIEPGESRRVVAAAERARNRIVDVLGTGPIALGSPINWCHDYRANAGWERGFARSIDYVNRDRPSDVKIPWEISRLQWLIPVGQAYLLSEDEGYAAVARKIIEEWIDGNPLAYTVNWSCTMEAALRMFTWTWFFHVFARSAAWNDEAFRVRFLTTLYLHGEFTLRHIEKSTVNGNHYTADLAGLVMAGLFFGQLGDAPRWASVGWEGLVSEIGKQVLADGVDYEASAAYHRLVFELFIWPALFRRRLGQEIPSAYLSRLLLMARFTASYARNDGTSPLWGDADDARALPFGGQSIGDHRYVTGMAAIALGDRQLASWFQGPRSELLWLFGPETMANFPDVPPGDPPSAAFPDGGCYIMRSGATHVFIDCGPIGLAGRGGHGHNDALSFEAWLAGAPLLIDCGCYVYTASFELRNRFRSTASHNTPMVDGEEINRLVAPDNLWSLHDDARPECMKWHSDPGMDLFVGKHCGYARLGVGVQRTIRLDKTEQSLEIADLVSGSGSHEVAIPFHLAPGVAVEHEGNSIILSSSGRRFKVTVKGDGWATAVDECLISPSYGCAISSRRFVCTRTGPLPADLTTLIRPLSTIS